VCAHARVCVCVSERVAVCVCVCACVYMSVRVCAWHMSEEVGSSAQKWLMTPPLHHCPARIPLAAGGRPHGQPRLLDGREHRAGSGHDACPWLTSQQGTGHTETMVVVCGGAWLMDHVCPEHLIYPHCANIRWACKRIPSLHMHEHVHSHTCRCASAPRALGGRLQQWRRVRWPMWRARWRPLTSATSLQVGRIT